MRHHRIGKPTKGKPPVVIYGNGKPRVLTEKERKESVKKSTPSASPLDESKGGK